MHTSDQIQKYAMHEYLKKIPQHKYKITFSYLVVLYAWCHKSILITFLLLTNSNYSNKGNNKNSKVSVKNIL